MGRADQTAKIRGMFVRPTQMELIRSTHPEIKKLRLTITSEDHRDQFSVACESEVQDEALREGLRALEKRDVLRESDGRLQTAPGKAALIEFYAAPIRQHGERHTQNRIGQRFSRILIGSSKDSQ